MVSSIIRGDGDVRYLPSDLEGQIDVLLFCVPPVHPLQDPVGTGLQRKMYMPGDFFIVPDSPDHIVGQILGVRCHETDPAYSLYFADLSEQVREGAGNIQIFAVGIDILPQQHDFHHTVGGKTLALTQDLDRLPAPLPPSHIGDYAVAAEIIAAESNICTGFKGIFARGGKRFHNSVGPVPDLDDHAF